MKKLVRNKKLIFALLGVIIVLIIVTINNVSYTAANVSVEWTKLPSDDQGGEATITVEDTKDPNTNLYSVHDVNVEIMKGNQTVAQVATGFTRNSSGNITLRVSIPGGLLTEGTYSLVVKTYNNTTQIWETASTSSLNVSAYVQSVTLPNPIIDLLKGQTRQLTPTIQPRPSNITGLTWKTSMPSVATIDENGLITAVGAGRATITVETESGKRMATCTVIVEDRDISKITLDKTQMELIIGESATYKLITTIEPANAINTTLTWSSSDETVATVSGGTVTAKSKGRAIITVETQNGLKATCTVVVRDPGAVKILGISTSPSTIFDEIGGRVYIEVDDRAKDEDKFQVEIKSNDQKIVFKDIFETVFVDPNKRYIVIDINEHNLLPSGDYNVEVSLWDDLDQKWELKEIITFVVQPYVSSVILNKDIIHLRKGVTGSDTYQLEATIIPADAKNKNVTWVSSDTSVATVDTNGLVKAVAKGLAMITVTTQNGNRTATCGVIVTEPGVLGVVGINTDPSPIYDAEGGIVSIEINNPEQVQTRAIIKDRENRIVTDNFVITQEKIVTEDYRWNMNIEVKAGTNYGTYTVDVQASNVSGGFVSIGTRQFTVVAKVTGITLNKTNMELRQNVTERLIPTIEPAGSNNNKTVIWYSDDPSIATVDQSGNVTGGRIGMTRITARTEEGNYTASCIVTVVENPDELTIKGITTNPNPLYDGSDGEIIVEINNPYSYKADLNYLIRYNGNIVTSKFDVELESIDNYQYNLNINMLAQEIEAGTYIIEIEVYNLATGEYINKLTTSFVVLANVTEVQLDKEYIELRIEGTEQLTATILPSNAQNKNISWINKSPSVVGMEVAGESVTLEGRSRGTAIIEVVTEDGSYRATCTVRVKDVGIEIGEVINPTIYNTTGGTVIIPVSTVDIDNGDRLDVIVKDSNGIELTSSLVISEQTVIDNKADIEIFVPHRTVDAGTYTVEISYKKENIADITETTTFVITQYIPVTGIIIDQANIEIGIGDTERLFAIVLPQEAVNKRVIWSSSNTDIATVDQNGNVTGVSKGTATITATTEEGNKSATSTVRVRNIGITIGTAENEPVNSQAGGTITIPVITEDIDNGTTLNVVIKNSYGETITNFSVTGNTVSNNGADIVVTIPPHSNDDRYTVEISYRGVTATESFIVGAYVTVIGVSIDKDNIYIRNGDTETLTAIVEPASATNKRVTWSSEDEDIAIVSSSGVVTGTGRGTTIITATTLDGGYTAECEVTVGDPTIVAGTLVSNPSPMYNEVGGTITIPISSIDISDDTAIGVVIKNNSGADVTDSFIIRGNTINSNQATVTITVPEGTSYGVYTVELTVNSVTRTKTFNILEYIHVTGVKLNKSSVSIKKGATYQLIETIEPAESVNKNVRWSSSDPSIVKVDNTGLITGMRNGTAVVTVLTEDGNKRALCTVVVNEPAIIPDSVEINTTIYSGFGGVIVIPVSTLAIDDNETLGIIIRNSDGQDVTNIFKISGNKITNNGANIVVTVPTIALNGIYEVELSYNNAVSKKVVFYITLKVDPPLYVGVDEIKLDKLSIIMERGTTVNLKATIEPSNATEQDLLWSSNNTAVATVTNTGNTAVITGVSVGLTKITVTTVNGHDIAECTIKVKESPTEKVEQTYNTTEVGGEKLITGILEKTKVEDIIGKLDLQEYTLEFINIKQEILKNDSFVGTGSIMRVKDQETGLIKEYTIVIKGDVEGDGQITATDLAKLRRHLAGIELLKGIYKKGAEMTTVDSVTPTDLAKVRRYLAGY